MQSLQLLLVHYDFLFFAELKDINRLLQIPEEGYKIKVYKFRKYDVTDRIDDLNLCENYLNFCVDFENDLAPAILITIIYRNNYIDKLKITGEEYDVNSEDFIDFLLRRITQAVSNFFN